MLLQGPASSEILRKMKSWQYRPHLSAGNHALCSNGSSFHCVSPFLACYLLDLLQGDPIPPCVSLALSVKWAGRSSCSLGSFPIGCYNGASDISFLLVTRFISHLGALFWQRHTGVPDPPSFKSPKTVARATKSWFSLSKPVGDKLRERSGGKRETERKRTGKSPILNPRSRSLNLQPLTMLGLERLHFKRQHVNLKMANRFYYFPLC